MRLSLNRECSYILYVIYNIEYKTKKIMRTPPVPVSPQDPLSRTVQRRCERGYD